MWIPHRGGRPTVARADDQARLKAAALTAVPTVDWKTSSAGRRTG